MGTQEKKIWGELAGPIGKFIRRRVRDEHAAEDLLQDVMLKAQANLGAAPPGERMEAWLFTIARNAVIDYYRSARGREVVAGEGGMDGVAVEDSGEDEGDLTGELAGCLKPMIEKMPEPYREALVLVDREGLTQQALAGRLGISVPGAKSRVQRARRMLREMMVDCCAVKTDRSGRVIDHRRTGKSEKYCGGAPGSCCDREG